MRPEYPINFDKPLASTVCRIQAPGQLNGTLDQLCADMVCICPDWHAASGPWIARTASNSAGLFRYVLAGPAISYPLGEEEIAALEEWYTFCAARGLAYNAVECAAKGQVLTVPVGSAVVAKAVQRIADATAPKIIAKAGGLSEIAARVFRSLDLVPEATGR